MGDYEPARTAKWRPQAGACGCSRDRACAGWHPQAAACGCSQNRPRIGFPVNRNRARLVQVPCPPTRPCPIGGTLHQSASHWIGMNVLHYCRERAAVPDVAVIPAALLPEQIWRVGAARGQLPEATRILSAQPGYRSPAYSLLDGFQDIGSGVVLAPGPDQQMNVLRHDHIGPDVELMKDLGPADSVREPEPSPVFGQHSKAVITRKGQLVGLAWGVPSPALLELRRVNDHESKIR